MLTSVKLIFLLGSKKSSKDQVPHQVFSLLLGSMLLSPFSFNLFPTWSLWISADTVCYFWNVVTYQGSTWLLISSRQVSHSMNWIRNLLQFTKWFTGPSRSKLSWTFDLRPLTYLEHSIVFNQTSGLIEIWLLGVYNEPRIDWMQP